MQPGGLGRRHLKGWQSWESCHPGVEGSQTGGAESHLIWVQNLVVQVKGLHSGTPMGSADCGGGHRSDSDFQLIVHCAVEYIQVLGSGGGR